jgi:uncharacterized protein
MIGIALSFALALHVAAAQPHVSSLQQEPPLEMQSYQLVLLRSASGKPQPSPAEQQQLSKEHLDGLADLNRKRVNLLYGPLLDTGELRGIAVLDVPTADAARAAFANDAYVKRGLMTVDVKPWMAPKGWFHEPAGYDVSNPANLEQLVLGFLVSGPNRTQSEAAAQDIQKGHLAYMESLAKQGKLVAAGPFLDDGAWRGIVIYRVASVDEAKELAAGDPAVKAGRLALEAHPWMTLRGILK